MSVDLFGLHRLNEPRSDITFRLVRCSDNGEDALFEITNKVGSKIVTAQRFTFEILALKGFEEYIDAIDKEIAS